MSRRHRDDAGDPAPICGSRHAGHILNISSMGGLMTFPGNFCLPMAVSSRWKGFQNRFAKEVKHLGIKVTIVEPGGFRTDWAGRSMRHVERTIEDY